MRTAAEVGELADLIEGDFIYGEILDQFDLVFFLFGTKDFQCLTAGNLRALEGQSLANQFFHPLFDLFEIFRGKRFTMLEIVIETILDGRTDRHFYVFAENSRTAWAMTWAEL